MTRLRALLWVGRRLDPLVLLFTDWRDEVEDRDKMLALAEINGGRPEDQKYWKWSGMTGDDIRRSARRLNRA